MTETIHLKKRLQAVADTLDNCKGVIDIGTDHAFLPIYLIQQELVSFAIACDVVEGPLANALTSVKAYGVEELIAIRLGSGFDPLLENDPIDCATICGMGGELIVTILNEGLKKHQLQGITQLVLQPNVGDEGVRRWLMANNYVITDETIVEERSHFYPIIKAKRSGEMYDYSYFDCFIGPVLKGKAKEPSVIAKWKHDLKHYEKILDQIPISDKAASQRESFKLRIRWLKEVIQNNEY